MVMVMADVSATSKVYWSACATGLAMVSMLVLGVMLAQRTPAWGNMLRWNVPAARVATFSMLVTSILYVFTATLLLVGVGGTFSEGACTAAGWTCLGLYGTVKVFIAWFLIERVYIVLGDGRTRRTSKLYLFNMSVIACWFVAVVIFVLHLKVYIRPSDESCVMITKRYGVLLVINVDIVTEIYLSLLFAVPLFKGRWSDPALRSIASKSLWAAAIAMSSSTANILVLGIFGWREVMSMCVVSCCLDTLINVFGIFAVTSGENARTLPVRSLYPSKKQQAPPTFSRSAKGIEGEEASPTLSQLVHLPKLGLSTSGEEPVAKRNTFAPFVHLDLWVLEDKHDENSGTGSWV